MGCFQGKLKCLPCHTENTAIGPKPISLCTYETSISRNEPDYEHVGASPGATNYMNARAETNRNDYSTQDISIKSFYDGSSASQILSEKESSGNIVTTLRVGNMAGLETECFEVEGTPKTCLFEGVLSANLEKGLFATHATVPFRKYAKKVFCTSTSDKLKQASLFKNEAKFSCCNSDSDSYSLEKKVNSESLDSYENDLLLDPAVFKSIRCSPIFSEVSDMDLEEVVASMIPLQCAAGQFILTEGEVSDMFFIVASGSFLLLRYRSGKLTPRYSSHHDEIRSSPGYSNSNYVQKDDRVCPFDYGTNAIPLRILCGRGACFGDANLILAGYSSARTVVCAEDGGVVYCISRSSLRTILAEIGDRRHSDVLIALRGVPEFSELHDEQLDMLADMTKEEEYEKRAQILFEEDRGTALYIVKCGVAQVRNVNQNFQRDYFAEPLLTAGQFIWLNSDDLIVMALDYLVVYKLYCKDIESYLGPLDSCIERCIYMQCLSQIPLLRDLGYKQLNRIMDMMKLVTYSPGQDIVREGDPSYTMHLLVTGEATVVAKNPDTGEPEDIATLYSVDYFGEGALQDIDPRNATVTTRDGATCLELHRDEFSVVCPSLARSRHIGSSILWSEPMARHPGELRPVSVLRDGQFGQTVLVDVNPPVSPGGSPGGSPKRGRYWNPIHLNTRRIVRNVAGLKGDYLKGAHLAAGQHPFIINLMGWFTDFPFTSVVLEHLEGGSMERFIREQPREARLGARYYGAAILSALGHLHERGVVFRGLRPRSILLDWSGQPRLSDFTLARELQSGKLYTLCGGLGYMAPEVVLGQGYNWMADFWSLGCLIYELFMGRPPFIDPNNASDPMQLLRKSMHADIDCDIDTISPLTAYNGVFSEESLPDMEWQELVYSLLQPKPWRRLGCKRGATDICQSSWFKGFPWEELVNRRLAPPWAPPRKNHSRIRGRSNRSRSAQRRSRSNNGTIIRDPITPPITPHATKHSSNFVCHTSSSSS